MRVAVLGGTGLTGRAVVASLVRGGYEAISLSRRSGVDAVTGDGLNGSLAEIDVLIDVTNLPAGDDAQARELFGASTRNVLAEEERAGVAHHVLLSIVGVDRIEGPAHYAGKRLQEELVTAGPIPFTILRATQFHDFAEMVVTWTTTDGVATVPPVRVQPVAVADVADVLTEIAGETPRGDTIDLAGPRPEVLSDMAQRTMAVRPGEIRVEASWDGGPFPPELPEDALLPGPDARLAPTTFDQWLAGISASGGR